MKKFFEEYRKQESEEKAQNEIITKRHKVRKVVTLAAATVAVLALGISTVGAWKGNMLSSYLKNNGEYSDLLNGKPERSLTVENVYFGYVPEGYEFEGVKENPLRTNITFNSKNNGTYFYLKMEEHSYAEKLNTESGEAKEIIVNDKDMILIERYDFKLLTWYESGFQNTLYTDDSEETLIKIVENIKFLK